MYQVEVEKFEGPLDLLLQLIEKEKMDICEISLAKITDSYLQEISKFEKAGDDMAEFMVIAAKLLYIKSKQLLPKDETGEEEEEIADLEARLLEYQKYKEAANYLDSLLTKSTRSYRRQAKNEHSITFLPPKDLTKTTLYALFSEALSKIEPEKEEKIIEPVKISLEEKKALILKHIKESKKISFKSLLNSAKSKVEIIVTFLAILEMIKQKEIRVKQENNFADFSIEGVK